MTPVPPPQGMSEVDYATIEAAVTETVRGRWFLNEFARRNRTAELRQLLDAMARIESVVSTGQAALPPPADPSIRLLMQRIKEIAGQLDGLSNEMREAGVDERFTAAIENEARAVSGMMRGPALAGSASPRAASALGKPEVSVPKRRVETPDVFVPRQSDGSLLDAPGTPAGVEASDLDRSTSDDPRIARLAHLDRLSLAEKLALFA